MCLMRRAVLVGLLLVVPHAGLANEYRLSAGVEITTGDYGDRTNTNVVYSTFSGRYAFGPWSIWATLPYVSVSGPGLVIDANVVQLDGSSLVFQQRLQTFLENATAGGFSVAGNNAGVGDVTIGAVRTIELSSGAFYADLSATLRLPTAERARRLGAGVVEGATKIDLVYLDEDIGVLVGGGRRFSGRSSVFPLADAWIATASVFKSMGPSTVLGVLYDWRQSEFADASPISEMTLFVSTPISERWNLVSYGVVGFSSGSPDYGIGIRLSYDFDARWFSRR